MCLPKDVGASPSGKASAFGADIRRFESCRPSQHKKAALYERFFLVFCLGCSGFETTRT